MAFGSLAHVLGAAEALKDTYDPVRAFVRKGTNRFEILMMGDGTAKSHFFSQPIWLPHCTHPVAELAIFGISFMVDFDPMSKGLNQVRAALTGQSVENWTMV